MGSNGLRWKFILRKMRSGPSFGEVGNTRKVEIGFTLNWELNSVSHPVQLFDVVPGEIRFENEMSTRNRISPKSNNRKICRVFIYSLTSTSTSHIHIESISVYGILTRRVGWNHNRSAHATQRYAATSSTSADGILKVFDRGRCCAIIIAILFHRFFLRSGVRTMSRCGRAPRTFFFFDGIFLTSDVVACRYSIDTRVIKLKDLGAATPTKKYKQRCKASQRRSMRAENVDQQEWIKCIHFIAWKKENRTHTSDPATRALTQHFMFLKLIFLLAKNSFFSWLCYPGAAVRLDGCQREGGKETKTFYFSL